MEMGARLAFRSAAGPDGRHDLLLLRLKIKETVSYLGIAPGDASTNELRTPPEMEQRAFLIKFTVIAVTLEAVNHLKLTRRILTSRVCLKLVQRPRSWESDHQAKIETYLFCSLILVLPIDDQHQPRGQPLVILSLVKGWQFGKVYPCSYQRSSSSIDLCIKAASIEPWNIMSPH